MGFSAATNASAASAGSASTGSTAAAGSSGLGTASLGFMVAGMASSMIGSYYGAQAQKSTLAFQASMNDINARIAEKNAQQTILAGQRQEQATRLQTASLKSDQRAAMAANGIQLGEGTAANVIASTDVLGEIDANTVAMNALRQAWGYRTQSTNYGNEALMQRAASGAISPGMSAATSLLGSAGSVAQSWYQMNKTGAR